MRVQDTGAYALYRVTRDWPAATPSLEEHAPELRSRCSTAMPLSGCGLRAEMQVYCASACDRTSLSHRQVRVSRVGRAAECGLPLRCAGTEGIINSAKSTDCASSPARWTEAVAPTVDPRVKRRCDRARHMLAQSPGAVAHGKDRFNANDAQPAPHAATKLYSGAPRNLARGYFAVCIAARPCLTDAARPSPATRGIRAPAWALPGVVGGVLLCDKLICSKGLITGLGRASLRRATEITARDAHLGRALLCGAADC